MQVQSLEPAGKLAKKNITDSVEVILKDFKYNFPDQYDAICRGDISLDLMKEFYESWPKKMKSGNHVKVRYLNKVKNDKLKKIMTTAYKNLELPASASVYSYIKGVKTGDLAKNFVGFKSIVSLDISDYYYSITSGMVEELYNKYLLGLRFSDEVKELVPEGENVRKFISRFLAILMTGADNRPAHLSYKDDTVLLQGTPHAGMIANSVLIGLDNQIENWCSERGYVYARYSDNFYIGSKSTYIKKTETNELVKMVEDYEIGGIRNFRIKKQKVKQMPSHVQQRILGIVVNEKLNISHDSEAFINARISNLSFKMKSIISMIKTNKDSSSIDRYITKLKENDMAELKGYISYIKGFSEEKYNKYLKYYDILEKEIEALSLYSISGNSLKVLFGNPSNGFPAYNPPTLVFDKTSIYFKDVFSKFLEYIDRGIVGYSTENYLFIPMGFPHKHIALFDDDYFLTYRYLHNKIPLMRPDVFDIVKHINGIYAECVNNVLLYSKEFPEGEFEISMFDHQAMKSYKLKTPCIRTSDTADLYSVFNAIWKIRKHIIKKESVYIINNKGAVQ